MVGNLGVFLFPPPCSYSSIYTKYNTNKINNSLPDGYINKVLMKLGDLQLLACGYHFTNLVISFDKHKFD